VGNLASKPEKFPFGSSEGASMTTMQHSKNGERAFIANFSPVRVIPFLVIALSVIQLSAATYYVSQAGSDSFDGTSEQAAWKTIDKIILKCYTDMKI
jgi:hypothetical protein